VAPGSRGDAAFGYALQAALFLLAPIAAGAGAERLLPTRSMERTVASVCDVCGKGPGFGNNVSHSHVRTRRRWNPNIQTVRAVVSGTPKRLNVCTSCIKAGKVSR
jgi:large subunit ribosomal protein L28